MVTAHLANQSIRPEWLFELANLIQGRAYSSASESLSDLFETFEADSDLECSIKRALLERFQTRLVTNAPHLIEQRTTTECDARAESHATAHAVEKAQRLLRTEHGKPWTVEAVSRRVGRNRTDLEAAFRRCGLTSVHAYLVVCRVDAAKELLRRTAWRVEGIAKEVGYRSKTSLYEQFRRIIGTTPDRYRERWKHASPTPDVLELLRQFDRTSPDC